MNNYKKINFSQDEIRVELHDKLELTSAEVSINNLPAGGGVPFFHSHKKNEEIYIILSGNGKAILDGEELSLIAGDCLRVDPKVSRKFIPGDSGMKYICIQAKAGSLESYTNTDGEIQ